MALVTLADRAFRADPFAVGPGRAAQIGLQEIGAVEAGIREVDAAEDGAKEAGATEIRAAKGGLRKIGLCEVRADKPGFVEPHALEIDGRRARNASCRFAPVRSTSSKLRLSR